MIHQGWGSTNPVFRNFFASIFLADAPQAVQDSFDELQRLSGSAKNVAEISEMNSHVDQSELCRQVI